MASCEIGFELPREYTSFLYLHTHLGDIGTVEAVCKVWNNFNGWRDNTLRIKCVNEQVGQITLTGRCVDINQTIMICSYLVSNAVSVTYEKTVITTSIEI